MPGNPLVRFDEGRVGRTFGVAFSPTLPSLRLCVRLFFQSIAAIGVDQSTVMRAANRLTLEVECLDRLYLTGYNMGYMRGQSRDADTHFRQQRGIRDGVVFVSVAREKGEDLPDTSRKS